ncbi:VanW family protein [Cohnella nanjingensis]|uniref:VanW family protein n=1 Tax=Cohnella nanjingensis TaxID=1387779 RepID=A0A7X0RS53_9BACL|nr:VanW family protein [Cohnella nanjingensis]MBB6671491.1 VanW family protein [Cohnella nanjingensis]
MRKAWRWAAVIVVAMGLGVGAASGYAFSQDADRRLPDGLTVGGLAVGGLGAEEAIAEVRARAEALAGARVSLGGGTQSEGAGKEAADGAFALRELGMSVEVSEAVRDFEKYRDAGWWTKGKIKRQLKPSYPAVVTWNEETFADQAEARWASGAETAPKNAVRTINERDEVVYTPEVAGTALDTAALFEEVKRRAPRSLADVGGAADGSVRALGVGLPLVKIVPEVTVASLREEGLARKIVEFTTAFTTSGEGRSHNVTAAALALNDTLLKPGDEFSYGDIVAKAEKAYGYKEAPVIVKGKLTPGIGGGICQVSSTLYNAIIRASGIEIVERRNHSLPVSYLPVGLDATFADGYIDFRFRNATGKLLLIKTVVEGKKLTVKLFGTMDERVRYDLSTEQVKVLEPKLSYVRDEGVALGGTKVLEQGAAGVVIDTYRLKYVDGKLTARDKLNRSTYRAQNQVLAVNPADPRLAPPEGKGAPSPSPDGDGGKGTPVEPV